MVNLICAVPKFSGSLTGVRIQVIPVPLLLWQLTLMIRTCQNSITSFPQLNRTVI